MQKPDICTCAPTTARACRASARMTVPIRWSMSTMPTRSDAPAAAALAALVRVVEAQAGDGEPEPPNQETARLQVALAAALRQAAVAGGGWCHRLPPGK